MPSILRQETFDLKELIDEGQEVAPLANCIYIIRRDAQPIYVGKTTIGVRERVMKHIRQHSTIGNAIKRVAPWYRGWAVEIWWIDRGLLEIERETIIQLQPSLNKTDRTWL